MNYRSETRVSDIVLSSPAARHILEDAGIDYCCGGDKSLNEACARANVQTDQLLWQLRQNSEKPSGEDSRWTNASLAELTKHIREHHHEYVRKAIPSMRALLAKIREKHGANHRELGEIEKLFGDIAREMLMHLQKEEQVLFPFIDAMERAANGNGAVEARFFRTVRNPIYSMMQEHDGAGALVRQIREQSSGFKVPADACTSYQAAYQALEEFEKDLHLHVHLENNILFPRAVELEAMLAA